MSDPTESQQGSLEGNPDKIKMIQAALRGPLPKLYANTFAMAQTTSDITVILLSNGVPIGAVSMSYIASRGLLENLTEAITKFETATGEKVPSPKDISSKMKLALGPGNA